MEEHIEKYREQLAQKIIPAAAAAGSQEEQKQDQEIDFFGDMEPTTIKQAKYYIANAEEEAEQQRQQGFARLQATVEADIPISVGNEETKIG